jgi:SAM-dependent methyltransferase
MGVTRYKPTEEELRVAKEWNQNIDEGVMGGYSRTSERFPHGDPSTYYPDLWGWIARTLKVRSVLDVGCGEGHCIAYFRQLGCDVLGVDGSVQARENSLVKDRHVLHDFNKEPFIPAHTYDLVWSCEFVEHVEEKFSGNFLRTFATAGRYVMMTFAEAGQTGWHHVNCQPAEYWIEKVTALGFRFDEELTNSARQVAATGHFAQKGLVFVRSHEDRKRIRA